jgi:hypothetical protein
MEKKNYKAGFSAGFAQLQLKYLPAAQKELYEILGIKNRNSFTQYKNGQNEVKASTAEEIEEMFKKYGVTENIWGVCEVTRDLRSVRQK